MRCAAFLVVELMRRDGYCTVGEQQQNHTLTEARKTTQKQEHERTSKERSKVETRTSPVAKLPSAVGCAYWFATELAGKKQKHEQRT